MDCQEYENNGYISIAMNITRNEGNPEESSVIYKISSNPEIQHVQNFNTQNLISNLFFVGNSEFFLLQTIANGKLCPYFKWCHDQIFNHLGYIPCNKASDVEPFAINHEGYVAVATNNEQQEIFKFSHITQKFELFQTIEIEAARNVKYFKIVQKQKEADKHFLVFSNCNKSVIYTFKNKEQFVPFQEIILPGIKKILSIQVN